MMFLESNFQCLEHSSPYDMILYCVCNHFKTLLFSNEIKGINFHIYHLL